MGTVNCSIPTKLALELRDTYGLKAFVESGLGQGTSALWAEKHFDIVVSVEIDRGLVDKFRGNYPDSNVIIVSGDSSIEMIQVMSHMTIPALFWLDAHTDYFCPVLAELTAINFSSLSHVVMIDDWRLFGNLPNWPSKAKVILFASSKRREVYEIDDVLVSKPCHI